MHFVKWARSPGYVRTVVQGLVLVTSPAVAGTPFGWTISASSTDAEVSWAPPLRIPGTVDLYLWFACSPFFNGLVAAEFAVTGTLGVLQFTPLNGFQNIGTAANLLLLNWSCPAPPALAGVLTVHDPGGGGTLCFGLSQAAELTSVDCVANSEYPMDYVGFASDGSPPCYQIQWDDFPCGLSPGNPPTSTSEGVESFTFGRVKAVYR